MRNSSAAPCPTPTTSSWRCSAGGGPECENAEGPRSHSLRCGDRVPALAPAALGRDGQHSRFTQLLEAVLADGTCHPVARQVQVQEQGVALGFQDVLAARSARRAGTDWAVMPPPPPRRRRRCPQRKVKRGCCPGPTRPAPRACREVLCDGRAQGAIAGESGSGTAEPALTVRKTLIELVQEISHSCAAASSIASGRPSSSRHTMERWDARGMRRRPVSRASAAPRRWWPGMSAVPAARRRSGRGAVRCPGPAVAPVPRARFRPCGGAACR